MSTVIKSTDQNHTRQSVAFNFEDMASQAGKYLEKVRAEAAAIVAKAQREAEGIRKRAEGEGRKAGQAAVEETVAAQLARQLATLQPALRQAIQELQQAKHAWLAHWEKSAVHVAAAIAGRVLRREAMAEPRITVKYVREALELAAGSPHVRLRLNPADHAALRPQIESLLKELASLAPAELIADPEITPGGCRLETRFGVIDQQFEAQLARIEEELT